MPQITPQITGQFSDWEHYVYDHRHKASQVQVITIYSPGEFTGEFHETHASIRIPLEEITIEGGVLRRHEPLILVATPSSCKEYVYVNFKDIDMELTFYKEDNIKEGLEEILGMKWKRYAMGNPQKMTPLAQKIRNNLLEMYEYISS